MLLESFKPGPLAATRELRIDEVQRVEREVEGYNRILATVLDPSQRQKVGAVRNRHALRGRVLYARLKTLGTVRHHEDTDTIWKRTLQVA